MKEVAIKTPLTDNIIHNLNIKELAKITGVVYTLRDASAVKLKEELSRKKKAGFNLDKGVIYFCGPSPTQKGKIIGSCGPTTSKRFEDYMEILMKAGVKGFIGKGPVSDTVVNMLKKHNGVYFVATGGAGAYLSTFVRSKEIIAYKDLGPEAVHKLEVKDFPTIVASAKGKTLFS
ncbi:MAG: fumarate hydratase C-terminal domain-containing protein [bacterium]|nr:fumarate hydratase C-terminal domain-containing protein [bacterium]